MVKRLLSKELNYRINSAAMLSKRDNLYDTTGYLNREYSGTSQARALAPRTKQNVNVHAVEHDNLKATIEEAAEDAAQTVRNLMDRWQEIGHVPFKEKDKIYAQYRELVDKAFETLNMRGSRSSGEGSSRGPRQSSGSDRGLSERDRLVRTYEQRMSELKTFENNMGFLTANTKSGNSLVQEMERRIARLKEEIAELEQKIKELDNADAQ